MDVTELSSVLEAVGRYPAATLMFAAWPVLFVVLLWWTLREHERREQALIDNNRQLVDANNQWRMAVERLSSAVEHLTARIERVEDVLARR